MTDRSAWRRRSVLAVGLAGLAILALGAPRPAAADTARAFIERLGEQVLEALQDQELRNGRSERIQELLDQATDVDLVGRLVLGANWRLASDEQREEYLGLFRRYALRNLTERLRDYEYGGETFTVTASRTIDDRDSMVTTRIQSPERPPLNVDWRVRERGPSDFAIIDVVVEGVSLVVSQRSEFASVISRSGFDGLLAQLRERAERGEMLGDAI